jgi:cob(I)alamin adenosyltransferase
VYTVYYYGYGKGKTTAALGLALRAAGAGKKVYILQFIKQWKSSEHKSIAGLKNIDIKVGGKGFYKIMGDKQPDDEHKQAAYQALQEAHDIIKSGKYDVVVLDEVTDLVQWGLAKEGQILDLIRLKPAKQILVMTGHIAPKEIIKACNLVTEMKKIKHPYDEGILAQAGIDF